MISVVNTSFQSLIPPLNMSSARGGGGGGRGAVGGGRGAVGRGAGQLTEDPDLVAARASYVQKFGRVPNCWNQNAEKLREKVAEFQEKCDAAPKQKKAKTEEGENPSAVKSNQTLDTLKLEIASGTLSAEHRMGAIMERELRQEVCNR